MKNKFDRRMYGFLGFLGLSGIMGLITGNYMHVPMIFFLLFFGYFFKPAGQK